MNIRVFLYVSEITTNWRKFNLHNELERLGWNEHFEAHMVPYLDAGLKAGRVAAEHRGSYSLFMEQGETSAVITGKLRYHANGREDYPAVGDWVVVKPEDDFASIQAILPRRSSFSRKEAGLVTEEQIVAANVDTVFLVTALNQDYNLRRIERMLVLAWDSGANPVILLSKSDLCHDVQVKLNEVTSIAPGVPIHVISALDDSGLEELKSYIGHGQTVALLGSSGVGKSTLVNRLLGYDAMDVNAVRQGDDRGRHTTTHRELLPLPTGGIVIDTPGMREFQLWDDNGGLNSTFDDILVLSQNCQFNDCRHRDEPGCAVRKAIQQGSLSDVRLQSYWKMERELLYMERKIAKQQRNRERGNRRGRRRG
jgi:ribosome biogenesis GTPase